MRKTKKPKKHDRAPSQTQISISLSKALLSDVDECAEADNRTRSNWIVMKLTSAIAQESAGGSSRYADVAPRGITLNEDAPVRASAKNSASRSRR